jgi:hypothetical protein
MRAVPILLLLTAGTSAGLAHMAPPPAPEGLGAVLPAQTGAPAAAPKKGRAGAKTPAPQSEKASTDTLQSCLGMWEAATHMSRQEWARACRRVDERLRNINAK